MQYLKSHLLVIILLFTAFISVAQDRCGTVEYNKQLNPNDAAEKQQFEQWLSVQKSTNKALSTQRTKANVQIPVVVHIIHNGESIGTGTNIPDAQVLSQIQVLNEDYQRLNADANNTPATFLPVAASPNIEFVLAKQTEDGLPTDGIVRVKGSQSSWTMNDNYKLKSLSYWPAENYLNIWVCNITDYLGYSQFPESTLPGLEQSSTNRLTDGVVIAYSAFGSSDHGSFNLEPKYDKGRTTTHELGHFFGLRHVWGDDSGTCSGTDYVDDTPNQARDTNTCPTHPKSDACSTAIMFQNFLDYTDDACMNLFTKDQVSRMVTVLQNSPRRKSLLTSPGLTAPQPVANDLGLRKIISPAATVCNALTVPSATILNYGSNAITQAQIELLINSVSVEIKDFSLNLNPLASTTITFSPATLTSSLQTVAFRILAVNNTTDGQPANDELQQVVTITDVVSTPIIQPFATLPSSWTIENPDQNITWTLVSAVNGASNNKALKMDFFGYEDKKGEVDVIKTPVFNLATADAALLSFDVAHAQYDVSNDGLRVVVLTDCNTDINTGTEIYFKSGSSLSTAPRTTSAFAPTGAAQWRTESRGLSQFLGQSNVQLAFIGINDWGNNLYLDNINILTEDFENLSIKQIKAPSPVTCSETVSPMLLIQNSGTAIGNFKITSKVNDSSVTNTFNINMAPGDETTVTLPEITLNKGENTLTFTVLEPNGLPDRDPTDDTLSIKTILNTDADRIPLRENFEKISNMKWVITNPTGGDLWKTRKINGNTTLMYSAFENTNLGDEAWFVSPVLDFSYTQQASLFFDLSYAFKENSNDAFKILASTDCGQTFTETLYSRSGKKITDLTEETSWQPADTSDWKNVYVELSALVEKQDVRLAFVFTNGNGNNVFIDNIEIFLSYNTAPLHITEAFTVYPNPTVSESVKATFNLSERQSIFFDVTDMTGKLMISEKFTDVLNQTVEIPLGNMAAGVYLVRVRTNRNLYVKKLMVSH